MLVRNMNFCKLIHGSSTDLECINPNTVHLALTSPPYGSLVAYNRDNPRQIGNYKDDDYFKLVTQVYRQVYRVLAPGRRFVVNIPNIPAKGEYGIDWQLYGDKTVEVVRNIGFELSDIIIWDKGRNRMSVGKGGTLPYPASPVLLNNWEFVYIFRKKGDADYSHVSDEDRQRSHLSQAFLSKYLMTVWSIKPQTADVGHPAPYPEELARVIIKLYSFVGEKILDPFGGSGTTARVAIQESRSIYIVELEDKYIDVIKQRVEWGRQFFDREFSYMYYKQDTDKLESIDVKPDKNVKQQAKFDKDTKEMDEKYRPQSKSLLDFTEE